jgi:hypothetical protein
MLLLPHFSQVCFLLLPAFSRNSLFAPHFLHLYSNIGIVISPLQYKSCRSFGKNYPFPSSKVAGALLFN